MEVYLTNVKICLFFLTKIIKLYIFIHASSLCIMVDKYDGKIYRISFLLFLYQISDISDDYFKILFGYKQGCTYEIISCPRKRIDFNTESD